MLSQESLPLSRCRPCVALQILILKIVNSRINSSRYGDGTDRSVRLSRYRRVNLIVDSRDRPIQLAYTFFAYRDSLSQSGIDKPIRFISGHRRGWLQSVPVKPSRCSAGKRRNCSADSFLNRAERSCIGDPRCRIARCLRRFLLTSPSTNKLIHCIACACPERTACDYAKRSTSGSAERAADHRACRLQRGTTRRQIGFERVQP